VLTEIAKRTPGKTAQLERLRGLHAGEVRRSGDALLAAVRRGLDMSPDDLPSWGTAPRRLADPRVDMFAALLDSVLRGAAANLRMSSRLMANRKDLEALARHRIEGGPEPSLPVLEGWRRECVGERLLSVLSGDLAPAVADADDGPGLSLIDVSDR